MNAKRGPTHTKRGFAAMDLGSLPHLFNSFTLDDSSLALIALLAGMAGGWMLTNWREQQLRTKKLKIKSQIRHTYRTPAGSGRPTAFEPEGGRRAP